MLCSWERTRVEWDGNWTSPRPVNTDPSEQGWNNLLQLVLVFSIFLLPDPDKEVKVSTGSQRSLVDQSPGLLIKQLSCSHPKTGFILLCPLHGHSSHSGNSVLSGARKGWFCSAGRSSSLGDQQGQNKEQTEHHTWYICPEGIKHPNTHFGYGFPV